MKFGKISYLNLAPFDVFIKKYKTNSAFKAFLNHNRNYPSKLNIEFLYKRIDAGFISSIAGMKSKKTLSGIISYGEVWSVIAIPKENKLDYQSASSNALSKILRINGEVLIGDRALKYKLSGGKYIDLGEEWYKKYRLPFVFGLLCYNKYEDFYLKLSKSFNIKNIKIPQYLLDKYSIDTGINKNDIKNYLKHIHYKVSYKPNIALSRFYRLVRINKIKIPSRF
ncbi:MqnA/MqnD/SBP family protein [Helicobacter sp. MIT 14-3879]|uniref:MqnA/MqnD/SBP family protein n=1 Tax=Helicobacter sp. MIT 14-3879 TaxID=2040649 RepID=UPI000E1E6D29|nr:MqnA/MqnD/SBP family protein [Helicobacter sp. MIT 14-3879]RDU64094.1 menaquinone biosynthesis protein [Helicobacter sp. MIT 14-3879]